MMMKKALLLTLLPVNAMAASMVIMWSPVTETVDGDPLSAESVSYEVRWSKDNGEPSVITTSETEALIENITQGAYSVTVNAIADGVRGDPSFPKVAIVTDKAAKPAAPPVRLIVDCPEPCNLVINQ